MAEIVNVSDTSQYRIGGPFRSIRVGRVVEILDDKRIKVDYSGSGPQGDVAAPVERTGATPVQRTSVTPTNKRRGGKGTG